MHGRDSMVAFPGGRHPPHKNEDENKYMYIYMCVCWLLVVIGFGCSGLFFCFFGLTGKTNGPSNIVMLISLEQKKYRDLPRFVNIFIFFCFFFAVVVVALY